jgi:hypothetical protein
MIDLDKLRAAAALLREAIPNLPDLSVRIGVHGAPESMLEALESGADGRSFVGDIEGSNKTVSWVNADVAGIGVTVYGPHVAKSEAA